jgi:hypothetical protein
MMFSIRSALGIAVLIAGTSLSSTAASAAAVVDINGGTSWTGWTSKGFSNQLGIYSSGSTTLQQFEIYTTSFLFENHAKAAGTLGGPTGGTTGFGTGTFTQGAFANGNNIFGFGIRMLDTQITTATTIKFDIAGDSYRAASSVVGTDGRDANRVYSHRGDYHIQFDRFGVVNAISVQGGTGTFFGGPDITQSPPRDSHGRDLPARMFYVPGNATLGTTGSYQAFFDMTALKSLWGFTRTDAQGAETWAGIGDVGGKTVMAVQGQGNVHVVLDGPVPEPATWAMLIAGFGFVGAVQRRRRYQAFFVTA